MLKGIDTISYFGAGHSTVINRLLAENVRIYKAKSQNKRLILKTDTRDRQKVIVLFDGLCYNYKLDYSISVGALAHFARKRFVLVLFAVAVVVMLCLIPQFVYSVDIECDNADESRVAATLDVLGVRRGVYKNKIDCTMVANEIARLDGVAFADVELYGSTVKVRVRGELPKEVVYDVAAGDSVRAAVDAVITRQLVFSGTAAHAKGDVVKAGDELILAELSAGDKKIPVYADGEVYGLVTYKAQIPFEPTRVERVKSGNTFTETVLDFLWIYGRAKGSPYAMYETRTERVKTGFLIPLVLNRITYFEIVDVLVTETFEQARERIEQSALAAAERLIPDDAVIKNKTVTILDVADNIVVEAAVTVEQRIDGET